MKLENGYYRFESGLDPLELCQCYGSPLYVYDFEVIRKQYKRMIDAFAVPKLKVNYACKAQTNINILRLMNQLGAGLDTVSIQEVQLALKAGYNPEDVVFTPNGVSMDELSMAVEYNVHINIDNLSNLEQFGHEHPDYPVGVRLNPHILAGGNSKISTGHIDSKFGISFHQMPLLKRIAKTTNMHIEGLHMHTGSEILDSEVFLIGAEVLFNVAKELEGLEYLNFGSGFKIPYKEDDVRTDIEDLGIRISERFNDFCTSYGSELTLMFEPGKYLVSESGYFFAEVNVVKQTTSTVFAGLDTGFNHLIRPMLYDSYHRILNISNPEGRPRIYTVVGYICETDTFGVNRRIAEIREGDVLCMLNAGAYCFAMSSNYNSRYRPAEVLIYENKDHLIRRRENFDDLVRNQIEIDVLKPQALSL